MHPKLKKLQPIINIAATEFKETEEFKTDEKHNTILRLYSQAKDSFEEKYGPRGDADMMKLLNRVKEDLSI